MADALAPAIKERPLLFSGTMVRAILHRGKTQTRRLLKPQPELRTGVTLPNGKPGNAWFWGRSGPPAYLCSDIRDLIRNLNADGQGSTLGRPGDRIWVRESWRTHERPEDLVDGFLFEADGHFKPIEATRAAADRWGGYHHVKARPKDLDPTAVVWTPKPHGDKWRPSIHMPREACRLVLEIESVRVEHLRDISDADALAEGVYEVALPSQSGRKNSGWTVDGVNHFARPYWAYMNLWDRINPSHPSSTNPVVAVVTFKPQGVARG